MRRVISEQIRRAIGARPGSAYPTAVPGRNMNSRPPPTSNRTGAGITAWLIGSPSAEGLHVIAYRGTLDVPRELLWFAAKLLAAQRRRCGTRGAAGRCPAAGERVLDPVQVRADRAVADE